MKNEKAEAGNFGIHRNFDKFCRAFNPNPNNQKFQCLNCEIWKRSDKFIAVGQFDQMTNEIFGFRFCRPCWQSYQKVSPELKKDFIENIRRKIKKASEVKIG